MRPDRVVSCCAAIGLLAVGTFSSAPAVNADEFQKKVKCEAEHAACAKIRSPFMCDLRLAYCMEDDKEGDARARPTTNRRSPLFDGETLPPSRPLRNLESGGSGLN